MGELYYFVEGRNSAQSALVWQTNRFLSSSFFGVGRGDANPRVAGGQSTFSMSSTIVLDARAKPELSLSLSAGALTTQREKSLEAKLLSSALHNSGSQKPFSEE